ncbi:hypothetical protein ACFFGR_02215 [Arthrobacter liuii]|uniref:Uncharacterized protein n=1 Tax=Arthrobacter liuii TaxID=1476996 RepID=A0ABQ2AP33_9MICC|nr:hypothetical protein [Arthrobacter liuii]GGH94920.1 hypothetical protein GCM10007170_19250 [Arthrobacter liuii]
MHTAIRRRRRHSTGIVADAAIDTPQRAAVGPRYRSGIRTTGQEPVVECIAQTAADAPMMPMIWLAAIAPAKRADPSRRSKRSPASRTATVAAT